MAESTERPVLGVIDTNTDIRDLFTLVFEEAGFRVIATGGPDLNRGTPRSRNFSISIDRPPTSMTSPSRMRRTGVTSKL